MHVFELRIQELGVQKIGHVKRFQNAIKLLKEESNDSVQETRDVCSTEVDTMWSVHAWIMWPML